MATPAESPTPAPSGGSPLHSQLERDLEAYDNPPRGLNQVRVEASTAEHRLIAEAKHLRDLVALKDNPAAQAAVIGKPRLPSTPEQYQAELNKAIERAEIRVRMEYKRLVYANGLFDE